MLSKVSKKRSIEEEHRSFQDKWELQYFCQQTKNKILCLICQNSIAVCKEYNLKRHYDTNHKAKYDEYVDKLREQKLSELKSDLQKQQNVFSKPVSDNAAAVKASYLISHLIASKSKPFSEGEFISECLIKTAEVLCPEMVSKFKNVSLSRNTVASRVDEIAENLREQLRSTTSKFEAYSVAIDESTDVRDIAQLAVFVRGCDENLKVTEELLEVFPMRDTTTGTDVFDALTEVLKKYDLSLNKLVCLATDGAPAMTGVANGVVGRLEATCKHDNHSIKHFHCIIHQEALCSKVIKMDHVLKKVSKIVNFIRARGLNHRQFSTFLEDLGSEHTDLPYYTEIRWLSSHKVLKRFFELLDVIILFLETKDYECLELKDLQWVEDLAFSVDITGHLSQLNLKLQGKNQLVTSLFDSIKAFKLKISLWRRQIENKNVSHFESCSLLLQKYPELKFEEYSSQLNRLEIEFDKRFSDFKNCETEFHLFTSPFAIEVGIVEEQLQMELIEIQCDSVLKQKYADVGIPDFYLYLSVDRFPKMRSFVTQILAMFGSTYLCEQIFSIMKNNRTPERTRLTDQHLSSILKITSAQDLKPNIDILLAAKRCQVSGKK